MSEFARWETRFAGPEYVFGTAPNEFLRAQAHLLPARGKALAVADGEGRNGVWLAEQGLDVLSVDFSPTAQAKAKALAKARGVALRTEEVDLVTWLDALNRRLLGAELTALLQTPGRLDDGTLLEYAWGMTVRPDGAVWAAPPLQQLRRNRRRQFRLQAAAPRRRAARRRPCGP